MWLLRLRALLAQALGDEAATATIGISAVIPINVPLPTKVVTEVPPPIDITAQFGENPDIYEWTRTSAR